MAVFVTHQPPEPAAQELHSQVSTNGRQDSVRSGASSLPGVSERPTNRSVTHRVCGLIAKDTYVRGVQAELLAPAPGARRAARCVLRAAREVVAERRIVYPPKVGEDRQAWRVRRAGP